MKGFGVEAGVEDVNPVVFALGEVEVASPDGSEEFKGFAFHAVEGTLAAGLHALESDLGVEVEQEGAMRADRSGGELIDAGDLSGLEGAGDALINGGGIEVAVAEDDFTRLEGGLDYFAGKLGAAGGKEEEFRLRAHRLPGLVVLDEIAQGFAEGGAAGFAGQQDLMAAGLQVVRKGLDLG